MLDLSAAQYLDSAGIAMLDMLRRATSLRLVLSPESIVTRALTVTGFDQLIPIFPSMEAVNL